MLLTPQQARLLFEHAVENHYAVLAVNADSPAAVEAGVAKVNWSSESLLIGSHAARDYYREHGAQLEKAHPEFKNTAMDNGLQSYISGIYQPRVAERIHTLGHWAARDRL